MHALTIQDNAEQATAAAHKANTPDNITDATKKIRNLQKKLKQIQQVKQKRDANGVSALTPEQMQKLDSEQAILADLQHLEKSGHWCIAYFQLIVH